MKRRRSQLIEQRYWYTSYTISESPRPGREHPGLSSRVLKITSFLFEIQSECF